MKREGVMNGELAKAFAELGHTDTVVIADVGLPRPRGVTVIDLAVGYGIPTFEQLLEVVSRELVIEKATVAREMEDANHPAYEAVLRRFGKPALITHDELKIVCRDATLILRTGEAKPFANVVLSCGVPF